MKLIYTPSIHLLTRITARLFRATASYRTAIVDDAISGRARPISILVTAKKRNR
jgi:hypothetical protein